MIYKIQNAVIKIDKKDKALLDKYLWYKSKAGYVLGNNGTTTSRKTHYLHRFLLEVKGRDNQVDHINRDKLDNRRSNLRICSTQQNSGNSIPKGTMGKGVRKASRSNKYIAMIKVDNCHIHIGTYQTIREAKDAYDKVAIEWFGDYALTNKMLRERGVSL